MADNQIDFKINFITDNTAFTKVNVELNKVKTKVEEVNSAAKKAKPFGDMNRSIEQLRANIERYKKAQESSFRTDHIKKYNVLIEETEKKIKNLEGSTATCENKTDGFFKKFGKAGIWGMAIAAALKTAQAIPNVMSNALTSSSEVEIYSATLKTMLGTSEAARNRMQEYFDIAGKTPFDLKQVVEAGNQLQAVGRYSRENLNMLGDLAAASGKPMEQVIDAYSRLAIGQKSQAMLSFRSLLISTEDWANATGKGLDKHGNLQASTEEMIKALPKIMKAKGYVDMMANQSETTSGKVANLEDAYYQLNVAIGERLTPTYRGLLDIKSRVIDKLTKTIQIPTAQKIAAEKVEVNYLTNALIDNLDKQDKRQKYIDELNRKYPELLKNMNTEKMTVQELRDRLGEVNGQYERKMKLAIYQQRVKNIDDEMDELVVDSAKYEQSIAAKKRLTELSAEMDAHKAKFGLEKSSNVQLSDGKWYRTENTKEGFAYRVEIPVENYTEKDRAEYNRIANEMAANKQFVTLFGNDEKKNEAAKSKLIAYNSIKEGIQDIINEEFSDMYGGSTAGSPSTINGDSLEIADKINGLSESISKGGKQDIRIDFRNLIENNNIYSQTIEGGVEQVSDKLTEALLRVVNSANNISTK